MAIGKRTQENIDRVDQMPTRTNRRRLQRYGGGPQSNVPAGTISASNVTFNPDADRASSGTAPILPNDRIHQRTYPQPAPQPQAGVSPTSMMGTNAVAMQMQQQANINRQLRNPRYGARRGGTVFGKDVQPATADPSSLAEKIQHVQSAVIQEQMNPAQASQRQVEDSTTFFDTPDPTDNYYAVKQVLEGEGGMNGRAITVAIENKFREWEANMTHTMSRRGSSGYRSADDLVRDAQQTAGYSPMIKGLVKSWLTQNMPKSIAKTEEERRMAQEAKQATLTEVGRLNDDSYEEWMRINAPGVTPEDPYYYDMQDEWENDPNSKVYKIGRDGQIDEREQDPAFKSFYDETQRFYQDQDKDQRRESLIDERVTESPELYKKGYDADGRAKLIEIGPEEPPEEPEPDPFQSYFEQAQRRAKIAGASGAEVYAIPDASAKNPLGVRPGVAPEGLGEEQLKAMVKWSDYAERFKKDTEVRESTPRPGTVHASVPGHQPMEFEIEGRKIVKQIPDDEVHTMQAQGGVLLP